jgi:hypothetical protein
MVCYRLLWSWSALLLRIREASGLKPGLDAILTNSVWFFLVTQMLVCYLNVDHERCHPSHSQLIKHLPAIQRFITNTTENAHYT